MAGLVGKHDLVKRNYFKKHPFYGFCHHIYLPTVKRQGRFERGVLSRIVPYRQFILHE